MEYHIIEKNEEGAMQKSLGLVGGGRLARILLGGLKQAGVFPEEVTVSDVNGEALEKLKALFPAINVSLQDNSRAFSADYVFLAVPPGLLLQVASESKESLKKSAVIFSPAPGITISRISEALSGFRRIVRVIPNAPSIIGFGFNPVAFSEAFSKKEREEVLSWLFALGECPEVPEDHLEAYAILTAMGPTYFWFQLEELSKLGQSFGLEKEEVEKGLLKMIEGSARILFQSGLGGEEVLDLIPSKPLKDSEETVREIFRSKLGTLYQKMRK